MADITFTTVQVGGGKRKAKKRYGKLEDPRHGRAFDGSDSCEHATTKSDSREYLREYEENRCVHTSIQYTHAHTPMPALRGFLGFLLPSPSKAEIAAFAAGSLVGTGKFLLLAEREATAARTATGTPRHHEDRSPPVWPSGPFKSVRAANESYAWICSAFALLVFSHS